MEGDKIKCGTFSKAIQDGIPKHVRAQMRHDRLVAQAKADGCDCHPNMQVIGCPAEEKGTCIHGVEYFNQMRQPDVF